MTKEVKHIYQSFLVRCWLISPTTVDEPATWRFELHEVSAESQKHRFSDFDQLKAFVAARLTAVAAPDTFKINPIATTRSNLS